MTEQAFRELAEYEWQTYRYGYVEDIDPDTGHIEIPARMSRTGNPVIGHFPNS